jgi:hypothetical protein
MWLENGDGGGDNNSLCFYVARTIPQMPLFEIDGVVNLFSARRAKERHLILVRVGGTARCGAKSNFWANRSPSLLSKDHNLLCVLKKMIMTKYYLPHIRLFIFFSCEPIYISDELVVAFLVFS